MSKPIGFATPGAFRQWLKKSHMKAPVLMLRCFKTHECDKGVTYLQGLDEARSASHRSTACALISCSAAGQTIPPLTR